MQFIKKIKPPSFAQCALYLSFLFVGIFHVYLSCILSVILLGWLWWRMHKRGELTVCIDWLLIAVGILVGGYAVTTLWAIDSGTAIFGFFKFLPVLLYTLVLMQDPDGKERVIQGLPYMVVAMTVVSVVGMQIPLFSTFFSVVGRLGGFVQYPNAFAIILLIAELLLITKDRPHLIDYLCISVLLFGILYTGSRTVFILAAASNVVALLFNKNKIVRRIMLGCIVGGIALVLLYCFITDNFYVILRYLKITANQSTFIGRLLYAQDALPTVLSHPFGIGYMGYYFIEQSIQTGKYAVMFIHNDFLQILLDVGWIPLILFLIAVVASLINRQTPFRYKLILVTALLHVGFDFDLQYVAIFMMLLLFITPQPFKTVTLKKRPVAVSLVTAVFTCLCLYFGTAQTLARFEFHDLSAKVYNHNTAVDIELIKAESDPFEAEKIADRILERNPYITIAYSAKARAAYTRGDFGKVIQYKTKATDLAHFSHTEYWEYARMLVTGMTLYEQAGDTASADFCKKELLSLAKKLPAQKERLSEYGKAIDQQPIFYFPKDVRTQIEALEGEG